MVRALALAILVAWLSTAAAVTLTRGNGAEPDTLDPHKYGLIPELNIQGDLFEELVTIDANGDPAPGMAESWTASPDGLVYTFKLRPGLKWSDGMPLTTDDIIAGFRRGIDPNTHALLVDLGLEVKNARAIAKGDMPPDELGVRAPDASTIEVTLEAPSAILIRRLAGFPLFAPLPLHVYNKAGDGWARAGTMVSNGPYRLVEWTPQSRVRLEKNPCYWDAEHVSIDQVDYLPTADDSAALKQFRSGELDLNLGFPVSDYRWLKTNMPDQTLLYPAATITFLSVNQHLDKFKDPRVRRALSLAIDRKILTDRVLKTGQTPAYGFVPSTLPGWVPPSDADVSAIPYNQRLAQAYQLLAEAGYTPDHPLAFRFEFRGGDAANQRVAVAISSMWSRIGIQARLQANEVRVHYAKLREGDFEIADGGWQGTPDPEFFSYLLETGSASNYGGWSNADYDKLITDASSELDLTKRMGLYQQADAIEARETAMIPLFSGSYRDLVQTYVKGYEPNLLRQHLTRYIRIVR